MDEARAAMDGAYELGDTFDDSDGGAFDSSFPFMGQGISSGSFGARQDSSGRVLVGIIYNRA